MTGGWERMSQEKNFKDAAYYARFTTRIGKPFSLSVVVVLVGTVR